jgi:hypothetical protein
MHAHTHTRAERKLMRLSARIMIFLTSHSFIDIITTHEILNERGFIHDSSEKKKCFYRFFQTSLFELIISLSGRIMRKILKKMKAF